MQKYKQIHRNLAVDGSNSTTEVLSSNAHLAGDNEWRSPDHKEPKDGS